MKVWYPVEDHKGQSALVLADVNPGADTPPDTPRWLVKVFQGTHDELSALELPYTEGEITLWAEVQR